MGAIAWISQVAMRVCADVRAAKATADVAPAIEPAPVPACTARPSPRGHWLDIDAHVVDELPVLLEVGFLAIHSPELAFLEIHNPFVV